MDIPRELIEQFVSLTNAAEPLASQLLSDSNLDVEAAVSSFFAIQDAGGVPDIPREADAMPPSVANDAQLAASLAAQEQQQQDEVRAPIPQIVDTLLPNAAPRRSNQTVYDPFTGAGGSARGEDNRLGQLFRPPEHLIFRGSLDDAMTEGANKNRWILVTIHQADIFNCQVLNRDIWNNSTVQQLLDAFFLFWQRDVGSDDGARYRQFYHFSAPPHIAIIDPRSGERVVSLDATTAETFTAEQVIHYLTEFTSANSLESTDPVRRPSIFPNNSSTRPASGTPAAASSSTAAQPSVNADDDLASTEEAQIAAAIAASIQSSGGAAAMDVDEPSAATVAGVGAAGSENGNAAHITREVSRQLSASDPSLNQDRSLRAQQDMEYEASLAMDRAKEESKREEEERQKRAREARDAKRLRVPPEPPAGTDGVAELVVRLPNNERIKRRFLVTHTIGDVYDFIEAEVDSVTGMEYDLMTPFPKKSFVDRAASIGDAGLSPRALLVVHVR